MDGEPAGANVACRWGSGAVPDADAAAGSLRVDERDDPGARCASSQRIPLEPQHHAARGSAPNKTWAHGLHSHHPGVGAGSPVGSPGNMRRQRQHRRSGTSLAGSCGGTGLTDEPVEASSSPSSRRSLPPVTCPSRCWFCATSSGMTLFRGVGGDRRAWPLTGPLVAWCGSQVESGPQHARRSERRAAQHAPRTRAPPVYLDSDPAGAALACASSRQASGVAQTARTASTCRSLRSPGRTAIGAGRCGLPPIVRRFGSKSAICF
jgi:hypothetical protein